VDLFLSDLHLGHGNIIRLCERPFASVEEMDAALIENWNRKVKKEDVVYVLGDVVWDKRKVAYYMEQLAGRKILITGNHDVGWAKREECQRYFELVAPYLELRLDGHPITLCHYPLLEWNFSREEEKKRLGYLIHGHIHNRVSEEYLPLFLRFNALNAGADVNGFAPVSFAELMENNLQFKLAALQDQAHKERLLAEYESE